MTETTPPRAATDFARAINTLLHAADNPAINSAFDDAARVAGARAAAAAADPLLDAVAQETLNEMPTAMREHLWLARNAAGNLRRHLDALAAAGFPAGIDDYLPDDYNAAA